MFWILLGAVSLVWCIQSAISSTREEGQHRAQWSGRGSSNPGSPSLWHALWFFASIVSIAYGYVQMATS